MEKSGRRRRKGEHKILIKDFPTLEKNCISNSILNLRDVCKIIIY